MTSQSTSPLTFDLQEDLLKKLEQLKRQSGAKSVSELVRFAVSTFDSSSFVADATKHRQISVRLSPDQRKLLLKLSKQNKVSVGEVIRAALESLPAGMPGFNPVTTMPKKKSTKKAAKKAVKKAPAKKAPAKKAVKKKVAKKVAKKAVKKAPAKKAVKKKVAKKVTKKAVKKKVAKKAAKKKVAKKVVKKATKKVAKKAAKKKVAKK
ncbi:MAG: ribbon-helix-helix protein, CopG family, partial [Verrucomicrobiota bacterium]